MSHGARRPIVWRARSEKQQTLINDDLCIIPDRGNNHSGNTTVKFGPLNHGSRRAFTTATLIRGVQLLCDNKDRVSLPILLDYCALIVSAARK